MNKTRWLAVLAPGLVLWTLGAPTDLEAQRSGAEIWRATCGNCHALQPPGRYTAKDWRSIGTHMVITARLTTAQGEAVLEFLRQGARSTAEGPSDTPDVARADRDPDAEDEPGPAVEPTASNPAIEARIGAYLRELDRTVPATTDGPPRED